MAATKPSLIQQVNRERQQRIKQRLAREAKAFQQETEERFAAFIPRLKTALTQVRREVYNLPLQMFDQAFTISEGNRQDLAAVTIRYVFRAIEVCKDKYWRRDMKNMRGKLRRLQEQANQKNLNSKQTGAEKPGTKQSATKMKRTNAKQNFIHKQQQESGTNRYLQQVS